MAAGDHVARVQAEVAREVGTELIAGRVGHRRADQQELKILTKGQLDGAGVGAVVVSDTGDGDDVVGGADRGAARGVDIAVGARGDHHEIRGRGSLGRVHGLVERHQQARGRLADLAAFLQSAGGGGNRRNHGRHEVVAVVGDAVHVDVDSVVAAGADVAASPPVHDDNCRALQRASVCRVASCPMAHLSN